MQKLPPIDPLGFEPDSEDAPMPLTDADLRKARAELAEWMDPREFQRLVDGFDKRSPSQKHFNDPRRNFLLEAWVLAELSKNQQFVQIRLANVDDPFPDGYALTETGEVIKIEVTSAPQGRHLGDEYKCKKRLQHDPIENCVERAESLPATLENAINDKLKKRYSCPFALVVDLTFISDGGTRQAETEQAIATIKDRYGPEFQHLWIFWKEKVF